MGSKSKSRTKKNNSRKSKNNTSNIITNRNSNINYPTGGKTHVKMKTKRHIRPSGKTVSITNSYMNKKGITRHTRTKEVHPYVPSI
jgi:hypothetical protein